MLLVKMLLVKMLLVKTLLVKMLFVKMLLDIIRLIKMLSIRQVLVKMLLVKTLKVRMLSVRKLSVKLPWKLSQKGGKIYAHLPPPFSWKNHFLQFSHIFAFKQNLLFLNCWKLFPLSFTALDTQTLLDCFFRFAI